MSKREQIKQLELKILNAKSQDAAWKYMRQLEKLTQ